VRTKRGSAATKMVIVYVHVYVQCWKRIFLCYNLYVSLSFLVSSSRVYLMYTLIHFFTLIHGQIVEEDAVGVLELGVLRDHD
jgi:hypothetical protein